MTTSPNLDDRRDLEAAEAFPEDVAEEVGDAVLDVPVAPVAALDVFVALFDPPRDEPLVVAWEVGLRRFPEKSNVSVVTYVDELSVTVSVNV